ARIGAPPIHRWQLPALDRRLFDLSIRCVAPAAMAGWCRPGRGQVALEAFVAPTRDQQLDREQGQQQSQRHNDLVPVGEDQVAEGRQEVLKSVYSPLRPPKRRPATAEQGRWLGAGTVVERRGAERVSLD